MPEFKTPEPDEPATWWELESAYRAAYAAVIGGVTWDGSYESIGGITKDEALEIAANFFQKAGYDFFGEARRDG